MTALLTALASSDVTLYASNSISVSSAITSTGSPTGRTLTLEAGKLRTGGGSFECVVLHRESGHRDGYDITREGVVGDQV